MSTDTHIGCDLMEEEMATNYNMVDQLGIVLAKKAELAKEETEIKAALVAAGVGSYEGELFRATVSKTERNTLDMKAVRQHLSPQFVRAHTVTAEVDVVRVVAKIGKDLAA